MNTPIKIELPAEVRSILSVIQKSGGSAYIVGGCVRDAILGRTPHDWDICTSLRPAQTVNLFSHYDCTVIETGLKHGTVTIRFKGENYEVTTFRKDSAYSDNQHPDSLRLRMSASP